MIAMYVFWEIICLVLIFALAVFLPVIYRQIKVVNANQQLLRQIKSLDAFFADKLQIVDRPLGIGPSQNSDILFCDAHKNQVFAVASISNLIEKLGD